MSLNIPSSSDPFPLGLHTLPLGLLDGACTQAGLMSWLKRRVAQHTFTHASLINENSEALTNFPIPVASCIGPTCEAGLSTDAWKGAWSLPKEQVKIEDLCQWAYVNDSTNCNHYLVQCFHETDISSYFVTPVFGTVFWSFIRGNVWLKGLVFCGLHVMNFIARRKQHSLIHCHEGWRLSIIWRLHTVVPYSGMHTNPVLMYLVLFMIYMYFFICMIFSDW